MIDLTALRAAEQKAQALQNALFEDKSTAALKAARAAWTTVLGKAISLKTEIGPLTDPKITTAIKNSIEAATNAINWISSVLATNASPQSPPPIGLCPPGTFIDLNSGQCLRPAISFQPAGSGPSSSLLTNTAEGALVNVKTSADEQIQAASDFAVKSAIPAGLGALVGWFFMRTIPGALLGAAAGVIGYSVLGPKE